MSQHAAPPTNTFSKRQITVPYVGTNDILVIFASETRHHEKNARRVKRITVINDIKDV